MPAGAGPHYDFTIPAGIGGLGRYGFRFKLTSFAGAFTITCRRIMTAGAGFAPAFASFPISISVSILVIPVSQVMLCQC